MQFFINLFCIGATLFISMAWAQGNPEEGNARDRAKFSGKNKEKLQERMKKMDLNQDGLISREEYQGPSQLFQHLDKNQDGSIDLNSELFPAKDGSTTVPGDFRPGEDERRQKPQIDKGALFDLLDQNKDGMISREEFMSQDLRHVMRSLHQGKEGKEGKERKQGKMQNSNFIQKFDKNADGKITSEELPEVMRGHFGKFDQNQDGVIDEAEIEALRQQRLQEGPRKKAPPQENKIDKDSDNF